MFEFFKDDDRYYIVMEICSGGELFRQIEEKAPFSESRTRILMKQILYAVNYMHFKDIVHRDIKPENLLIDGADHSLKLVDFGLSIRLPQG